MANHHEFQPHLQSQFQYQHSSYQPPNQGQQYQYQPAPPLNYQYPPHPQNPYPPPQPHPPTNNRPSHYDHSMGAIGFVDSFKVEEPKFRDLWAALLFLATFSGFVVVSVLSLRRHNSKASTQQITSLNGKENIKVVPDLNIMLLFVFILCVALFTSMIYFWIIRVFTKQAIWITGILQILFGLGTAAYYILHRYWGAGITFLIFTAFYVVSFISWVPRIPFSVLMLQTVMDVSKTYGHVFMVSLLGSLSAAAFGVWFSITLVSVYANYYPGSKSCEGGMNSCSMAKVVGLLVFITFVGYWTTEIIKNIIHVSISGVYGSWYFFGQKPEGVPNGPTRGALKRAVTYSFGSVSLGSLLVSLIQMFRQACSIAKQTEEAQGNILGMCFFCCMGFLIDLLNWAVQFLNEYAFSYIALYGKSYFPATWKMIKDRGVDVLINECLINPVLTMGAVFVAYTTSLFAIIYLNFATTKSQNERDFSSIVMAFSFLIGLQIANTFLVPIKSGVATLFVAIAFDPHVLIHEHGDLWQKMVQVYPHVQVAIHA
ncbi:BgTH12-04077 [Blumeria graminis f. sp. triticale]|uniref:Protein PNS1 n=1 Tax=Blumeria graminis f. sp. triticale TaxID=1689686 RepID=A0A9W4GBY6_BLUGR|nr:BgTH12-04077 [Blumeria graminis f. sp. triticale]